MIDFGTLENHRVITQSLNHAEWDLVRVFVRKLDSNDIWMRFGRPLDLQQDVILKQFFDIRAGTGEIIWSRDEHGAIAGLLHRVRVSSSEAEIGLVVRSDLKRNGIGEESRLFPAQHHGPEHQVRIQALASEWPSDFRFWVSCRRKTSGIGRIKMKKISRRTILGTAPAMAATPAFAEGCPVGPGRRKRRSWLLLA